MTFQQILPHLKKGGIVENINMKNVKFRLEVDSLIIIDCKGDTQYKIPIYYILNYNEWEIS